MSVIQALLRRLGYVRLSHYGLLRTGDDRIVSLRPLSLDDGLGARVVGWPDGDLAAMELAPWRGPLPATVEWTTGAAVRAAAAPGFTALSHALWTDDDLTFAIDRDAPPAEDPRDRDGGRTADARVTSDGECQIIALFDRASTVALPRPDRAAPTDADTGYAEYVVIREAAVAAPRRAPRARQAMRALTRARPGVPAAMQPAQWQPSTP